MFSKPGCTIIFLTCRLCCKEKCIKVWDFPLWECLNVGTVPTYKMHNIGTVPMFKMHNIGTPKIYDLCFELEFGLFKGK